MSLIASTPVDRLKEPYARRWWALLVLCLSLLIVVMANTSLIVAAPDMTRDLHLSSADLQWVIDGYTVPYAALMLVLGAVGDKFSRRGALIAGLVVFAGGAVAGSLVHTAIAVIVARATMGIGAAVIMPATLSLLVATFPRAERAKAITAWSATSGLAIALGPLLAGWLLQQHSWGSTFLINVPIAAIAIVAALVVVPPSRAAAMGRLDLVGGLLSVITVGSLVYAIIEGPHFGWGAAALGALAASAVGLVGFVLWELRHPHPILNVRKFADRMFSGSVLAVLFFFLGAYGTIYYATQHLQFVLGYNALSTGVRLLPLAGAVFVGAALTNRLTPRLGMKLVVVLGMALGTAAILLLARVGDGATYTDFLPTLAMLGLAIGLSTAPCTDTIMGAFPESELGVGGGINDTALELGGSLGIAILGSILATTYRDKLAPVIAGHLPEQGAHVAKDSIGGALAVADQVAHSPAGGPGQAQALVTAADHAFTHAVAHTSLIGGIILAVGTVLVAVILPRHSTAEPEDQHSDMERVEVEVG
ncbi:major facilitator superfamily MFS_1 [Catenulispora acidiphila DSM 44928]|uniref:Major facilitator superfamily MFS_1 n=1 Tax=Catenulispora acidiphila (strain DSM 44928 / JCM 14897 / NBRC 102108 / NRRL B-24433 / ID139908) TaxID=479433 RepID=C7Q9T8_CATAD|nr:MFS transporter [Catenulispora acidiphila]ACU76257.1 major facilitator superfamily MFS_1 [Catenulispora acidiphila DSM 44928]